MGKCSSPFGFSTPEQSPGFLLWQVTTRWQRAIRHVLDKHALTHPQFVLLALTRWYEEKEETAYQVTLIQRSQLDKMTVSKSLKQLVHMELLIRKESETDSRTKQVSLTDKGRQLIEQVIPQVEAKDKEFFHATENQTELLHLSQLLFTD